MRDEPAGLDERELIAACRDGWAIDVTAIEYLPVGAGSYHWSVTDRRGARWFVKVDHVPGEDALEQLRASLTTALALHRDAGLDFVLAPVPAADGSVLRRLTFPYAQTVFPMIVGTTPGFGPHRREDLPEMIGLLTRLHRATPAVVHLAPRTGLRLPGREGLHEALADLGRPWTTGPYAEPARDLLSAHAAGVERWLADFDRLAGEVAAGPAPWVVTHGEPHPGNVLRTPAGTRFIDWGTVEIAPPERDLWMLTTAFTDMLGADPVGSDIPGINPAAVAYYRRRWELGDVVAYLDVLRRPHSTSADAAAALHFLTGNLRQAGR
jgi:Ser/Thr protein kinase RdoA (MazF antagonist)